MQTKGQWYIVKTPEGSCQILEIEPDQEPSGTKWGPFASFQEAIARRVGLIRAGKCQPL